jgi:hypothetical protein
MRNNCFAVVNPRKGSDFLSDWQDMNASFAFFLSFLFRISFFKICIETLFDQRGSPIFVSLFYIYPCFIFFRYSEGLMPNSSLKHWRK